MGFWGTIIVARTVSPLASLPAVQALGGEVVYDWAGTNGWRLARINRPDDVDEAMAQQLVDEVGGPVLFANVLDSDTALVLLMAPGREETFFVLNEPGARAYEIPVDPAAQATAPAVVLEWAGAGDLALLEAAVRRETVFAEDGVLVLASAFGAFRGDELSDRTFGSDV